VNSIRNAWMKGSLAVAVALLLPGLAAADDGNGVSLKLLKQFSYERTIRIEAKASTIAFDRGHIYLSSPDGEVLETDSLTSSSPLRIIFQPPTTFIDGLYVFDGVLYVPVRPRPGFPDHTLFASSDEGRTFQAIDKGLEDCASGTCSYLEPTQVFAENDSVFVNAGGGFNLMVTADDGETYTVLSGELAHVPCYDDPFAIFGKTVILGGECKLDNAFLWRGELSGDRKSFAEPLTNVDAPQLDNRKVNAVAHKPNSSLVYAALEGRLLRSTDGGKSFAAVYNYPVGGALYPYVGAIAFGAGRDLTVVGGWNKGSLNTEKLFLAYARNKGTEWTDISELLNDIPAGIVTDLKTDEDGRLIAVVVDVVNNNVLIYQVRIPQRDEED
jgi:hypothetical protein